MEPIPDDDSKAKKGLTGSESSRAVRYRCLHHQLKLSSTIFTLVGLS
jgi:hypothetical protein